MGPLLDSAGIGGARLRQGVRVGKGEWPVFDDSGERTGRLGGIDPDFRRVAVVYLTPAEFEQPSPGDWGTPPTEPKEVRYLTPSPRATLAAPEAP